MMVNEAIGVSLFFGACILGVLAAISEIGFTNFNELPWQITYIIGLLIGNLLSILGGNK